MRVPLFLAAGLLAATLAPAHAELFPDAAIDADELSANRGTGDLNQTNLSDLSGTNNGNVTVSGGAHKYSGTIAPATVTNNHGITAVMQNTGDLVNINNATSVNVYMR